MSRPWYAFYPADYARDTGDLTIVEHGAYRLLMDHYYSTGEPLSTSVERLLRLCRATTPTEQEAVRFVLDHFFVLGDDGYHHLRIDAELVKAAEKAAKCSAAGTASAAKRQQSAEQNDNGRTNERSTDVPTERQPSQSQSQSHKKERDARMARFQEFWEACPKRTGRGAAERAWFKATSLVEPEIIIAAMRAYARTQIGKDPAYTKTPGPWLNEKRWADEGLSPPPAVFENTNERGWSDRLRVFREQGIWAAKFGPRPGEPGCKCPPEILNSEAA